MLYFHYKKEINSGKDSKLNNYDFLQNEIANKQDSYAQDTVTVLIGYAARLSTFSNLRIHTYVCTILV